MHLEHSRTISATEVHDFTTTAINCFTVALCAKKWVILTTTTTTTKSSKLPSFKKALILKWKKVRWAYPQHSISKQLRSKTDMQAIQNFIKHPKYAALLLVSNDLEFEFSSKIFKLQHCFLTSNILIKKKNVYR